MYHITATLNKKIDLNQLYNGLELDPKIPCIAFHDKKYVDTNNIAINVLQRMFPYRNTIEITICAGKIHTRIKIYGNGSIRFCLQESKIGLMKKIMDELKELFRIEESSQISIINCLYLKYNKQTQTTNKYELNTEDIMNLLSKK